MKKNWLILGLMVLSLLLGGCAQPALDAEPSPLPTEAPPPPLSTPLVEGKLADQVRALLSPYEAALEQASLEVDGSIAYTIPGDMLMQMASDAQSLQESARNGRYVFSWHSEVNSTYVATMDDAAEALDILQPNVTPDPKNDAPIDSQQFGDYAVAGGGLYNRTRAYDVAADLSGGTAEITELLNDEQTGHELFSFAVRGEELYFVDASLDVATDLDELVYRDGYLVTVGVLRASGLETAEYHVDDSSQIPDPATLNLNRLLASITPDRRVSVTVRAIQITP